MIQQKPQKSSNNINNKNNSPIVVVDIRENGKSFVAYNTAMITAVVPTEEGAKVGQPMGSDGIGSLGQVIQ